MIKQIKKNLPKLEDLEVIIIAFNSCYSFNRKDVDQSLLDVMFDCYLSGILTQRDILSKSCGPTRCADCTGKCGK